MALQISFFWVSKSSDGILLLPFFNVATVVMPRSRSQFVYSILVQIRSFEMDLWQADQLPFRLLNTLCSQWQTSSNRDYPQCSILQHTVQLCMCKELLHHSVPSIANHKDVAYWDYTGGRQFVVSLGVMSHQLQDIPM